MSNVFLGAGQSFQGRFLQEHKWEGVVLAASILGIWRQKVTGIFDVWYINFYLISLSSVWYLFFNCGIPSQHFSVFPFVKKGSFSVGKVSTLLNRMGEEEREGLNVS